MPQRETVRKCNLALTNSSLGPHNSPVYSHCRHYLTEPIGATKPNIPRGSEADILSAKSNAALSLACPAQSYPAPGHRCEMLFLSFSSETPGSFSQFQVLTQFGSLKQLLQRGHRPALCSLIPSLCTVHIAFRANWILYAKSNRSRLEKSEH